MRILVVEDQENLAKLIKKGLEAEGFAVDYVLDGEAGFRRISMNHKDYDLFILDWMLPKKNGDEICREARAQKISVPILMLTARDSAKDIANGLDAGADDYLSKPFSFEVLLARIRAILRRPKIALPLVLQAGDIILDPTRKQVSKKGKDVKLTLKEFSLLEYLMRNKGVTVTREQILSNIWDFAFDSFANVVDVHITNLRKKIGDKEAKKIETVRGVGYRMNDN
ncbi:MAG: Response regulator receiver domain protein (CheY-like) [Candidatus Moranbacteria bacterium GW2011_GWC1_45_18]|nr:MAG: Response regulator receiver domain protein (CheY-like) [Candidatus Moranbacteria bacterium GW2011_GWC2_40_12]KKT33783.1 MAG: Response regulator receiver domain protein (CheY-like) [Candidatus Moranbacteria bacterium GW2011_GWF2_44_10]KKU00883.1 MAG: Response regulator receiver domain protein (CheY-like) [Candidatus Moranbacteria bacterium GW2011_GWC1_45_18]OGI34568.1 MAG: DNA-binding response regulator [Candidatus Moranbacteria bacterium RIFOXYC1_FULL_44_8]OGI40320.1 MAG: DNA-binding re